MFRGVLPYILGDLHGTEMRGLCAFLRQRLVVELTQTLPRAFALSGLTIYVRLYPGRLHSRAVTKSRLGNIQVFANLSREEIDDLAMPRNC